ncbi:hypothetical protein N9H36_00620 [Planktomarina temperata]|nr:hypothetical protein [Planktomarina temperata]
MVRVTVFVSGFATFFANATTLLLVLNINSSAAHFVSSSTRSISLRMAFKACCISCSALLFIQLFSNLQIGVGKNHHLTSVSTPPKKSAARKFTV